LEITVKTISPGLSSSIPSYVAVAGFTICVFSVVAILVDLSSIHIFRHDSIHYLGNYLYKLKGEGRWINYLLFPYLKAIPGQAAAFLNILFFFSFCSIAFYKWTKNHLYSLSLALLFIQIYPLYSQILWPATHLPAFTILLLAALLAPRLPLFVFYSLFGLLFLGTMSNFYYLLPLLHLNRLDASSLQKNIRIVVLKIIPVWAMGFVFGYLVIIMMIYLLSGQHGMVIDPWRSPHYIQNIHDLTDNIQRSFSSLAIHVHNIAPGYWRPAALIAALLVGLSGQRKQQYIPMILLAVAIVLSHYVIILPVSIVIVERTVIATWAGIMASAFLIPSIEKWQRSLVVPIIALLSVSFYMHNHQSLKWYTTITNTYHDMLRTTSPLPPHQYAGVILQSDDKELAALNRALERKFNLTKGAQEDLDQDYRWKPAAIKAGFKDIHLCGNDASTRCKKLTERVTEPDTPDTPDTPGLYQIIGTSDSGYLVIKINPDFLNND